MERSSTETHENAATHKNGHNGFTQRSRLIAQRPFRASVSDETLERMLTRKLIKADRAKAKLSENRRRVRPRSEAQVIVDDMRSNPLRGHLTNRSYIYFIRCREYVKIGRSDCVVRRLAHLQMATPDPLELLGCFIGVGYDEQMMHHQIKARGVRHIRGEWFSLDPLVNEIIALLCRPEGTYEWV